MINQFIFHRGKKNQVSNSGRFGSYSAKWVAATSAWVGVVLSLCLPSALAAMPAEASPQVSSLQVSTSPVEEIAVSETAMEQVLVPESYELETEAPADVIEMQQKQVRSLTDASAQKHMEDLDEITLARALISSPTAVVGVSFPRTRIAEDLIFSYRTRSGNGWSEWHEMEMSEPSEAALQQDELVAGSDPVTVVDVEEIEVSVKDAQGNSIPGAVLNVLEPELEAADLKRAQLEIHGEAAVEASTSVLKHIEDGLSNGENDPQSLQSSDTHTSAGSEMTDAERAEGNAELDLPAAAAGAGAQGVALPSPLRATGLSADGNTFTTNIPGLTITTRKGWGADEDLMEWEPDYVAFKGAVIHHTAGSNNYTKAQVPGLIRGIYRYHAVTLGWGDVGYHLLVDKFGGVWEGRAGGMTKPVEGGHAFGANASTFGVSVLGNFQNYKPSEEAVEAVSKAIAWKLKIHNITDLNRTFVVPGKQSGKSSVILPVISGHRHVGGTACPGEEFVKRIPDVRNRVRALMESTGQNSYASTSVRKTPNTADFAGKAPVWSGRQQIGSGWNVGQMLAAGAFSGRERSDAILIDSRGDMWLYPGQNNSSFPEARRKIGTGWYILDQVSAGTDFDGDGNTDIIGRLRSNGDLRLYSGDGSGGFKAVKRIGTKWDVFSAIYVLPRMANGNPVIYGVEHETGRLRAYLTDGKGHFTSVRNGGSHWHTMRALNTAGDQNGDGANDLIAIDNNGRMWLYVGDGEGQFGVRVQIGRGWQSYAPVHRSTQDGILWAVGPSGALYSYTFSGLR